MIFDSLSQGDDYLDCSRQTLQTLHFRFTDTHGNIVPLEGYMLFPIMLDIISQDNTSKLLFYLKIFFVYLII